MNGVIIINKTRGMTSHDVVLRLRRILREKRIGHTGTLDPMATGVLVLCIGAATRIARYLEAGDKEYRATLKLGVRTDTLDADGSTQAVNAYTAPERQRIENTINRFVGTILQAPPAFSAVKVNGIPSYQRAREGNPEPNKPRPVTIMSIELERYEDPFVTIKVRCGKGVYIRTLCSDIGDVLGMGAHVTELQRTRSGLFTLGECLTLEDVDSIVMQGKAAQALVTMSDALADFPGIVLNEDERRRVVHGNRIDMPPALACTSGQETKVRLLGTEGELLAVAAASISGLQPEAVFLQSCE